MFVFIHSLHFTSTVQNYVSMKKNSIINKRNSSKRQYFLSKVELWCFRRKNLTNKQLHLDSDLAVQSWTSNRKPDGKVLVTWLLDVRGSREMPKNLDLKVSIFESSPLIGHEFSSLKVRSSIKGDAQWENRFILPFLYLIQFLYTAKEIHQDYKRCKISQADETACW